MIRAAYLLLAVVTSIEAFSVENRRNALASLLGSGAAALWGTQAASATTAKTGSASPFTGDYDDPNHPGCLRQVKVVGSPIRGDGSRSPFPVIEVVGYDGKDGKSCGPEDRPARSDLWKLQGTVKTTSEAVIDFSPKGGPSQLTAKYDNGMVFPDGNVWKKVQGGTNSRRPKDMSTLKSSS